MDFSHIGRNDPCPCGSGRKFKNCHMGREDELLEELGRRRHLGEAAFKITRLPACRNRKALEMVAELEVISPSGKRYELKLVDLEAYLELGVHGLERIPEGLEGIFINPAKTMALDPTGLYVAIAPHAHPSSILHELAHALDYARGSRLPAGYGRDLAVTTGIPPELLEHPQEFGDILLELARQFGVELDAEDEIVAFLAERQALLPGRLIASGDKEKLLAEAEKTLKLLMNSKQELNKRIKGRRGYLGEK